MHAKTEAGDADLLAVAVGEGVGHLVDVPG